MFSKKHRYKYCSRSSVQCSRINSDKSALTGPRIRYSGNARCSTPTAVGYVSHVFDQQHPSYRYRLFVITMDHTGNSHSVRTTTVAINDFVYPARDLQAPTLFLVSLPPIVVGWPGELLEGFSKTK